MAQLYCTGPAHIYVGSISENASPPVFGAGTMASVLTVTPEKIRFLGTCETAPRIDIFSAYRALRADIGGSEQPFDKLYMGDSAKFTGVLNRWNETVYEKVLSAPAFGDSLGSAGSTAIGTPVFSSGINSFHLWIIFPFTTSHSVMSGQQVGYHFYAATYPNKGIQAGTSASRRFLQFDMNRVYRVQSSGTYRGDWFLYDQNMASIPTVPPIVSTGLIA